MPEVVEAFGFGSFFRDPDPADCDVLLVLNDNSKHRGHLHACLSSRFRALGDRFGIIFDVTILTESEHRKAPLREHSRLIQLLP